MRDVGIVEVYAGSAEDLVVPLLDDADEPVVDLSGWGGRAQVRYSADALAAVLAEWSTADLTMRLENSSARLVISATVSLTWTWRLARFDLRLTAPPGQGSLPNRPIRGWLRVIPAITR